MKKIKQSLSLLTMAIIAVTLTTSCTGGMAKTTVHKLEKCLGNTKSNKDAEKLSKQEAIEIAKCMLGHFEKFQKHYDKLSSANQEIIQKAYDEALDKSEFKEMIKILNYNEVKELAAQVAPSNTSENEVIELATQDAPSNTSDNSFASSGSEDWDQMLDDYDEYVTEYVKFYKKAMKGDQSAMAEYPDMMEKATNLSESMQRAQSDNKLSASQIRRMLTIQTKMVNEISEAASF